MTADIFRTLARATNDAVGSWNVKDGTLRWRCGLESLLGRRASAKAGKIAFWLDRIHPEDRQRIQESIHQALAGPEENWTGEYRFRHEDGRWMHILERALSSARSPDPRVVSSMMDVTERKQLQTQVCRSQRMEAFGQLAGGVAHDFNNFLTTILGYSDLLLSEKAVHGTVANHISEIRDAADRAAALTNQLLAFSRRQALEPTVLEVNSLITQSGAFPAPAARRKHLDRVPPASSEGGRPRQSRCRPAHPDHPQSRGQRARCHARRRPPND